MDFLKAFWVILRCNKDGVKAALDKSFWEGIDVGNTDAMTNTISMEKRIEAVEAGCLLRTGLSGVALASGLD